MGSLFSNIDCNRPISCTVAVTNVPPSSCTATLFTPVPPTLSCEVPDTIRLPASTLALFIGLVIVTVGGVVSPLD